MRNLLLTQVLVKVMQFNFFGILQRPTISVLGEFEHCLDVFRLGIDQPLAKCGGALLNRLAQWFEYLWIGILRGILPELLEGIDQRLCILTDVMEPVPK